MYKNKPAEWVVESKNLIFVAEHHKKTLLVTARDSAYFSQTFSLYFAALTQHLRSKGDC